MQFENSLAKVEAALEASAGPYFLGEDLSVVDVMFAPFLERAVASVAYFKGMKVRCSPGETSDWPNVNRWFDAMETRPSYQASKSDYYTHAHDLPPQLGGCGLEEEGRPYARSIDGEEDDGLWKLPLPTDELVEPDWGWYSETEAKRIVVERLVSNHQAIAAFAARGCGSPGMPPVMAPLADPRAVANQDVVPALDLFLRLTAQALLDSSDDNMAACHNTVSRVAEGMDPTSLAAVAKCVRYLRDRVGVPRDMPLPAARQFRAHLNSIHDSLCNGNRTF